MHLLFLGVVQSVMDLTRTYMKSKRSFSWFVKDSVGILEDVNMLSLDWVTVQPFKEGLGGWVSENYLGFARISRWFYHRLENAIEEEPYKDPEKPFDEWTKRENKEWLYYRDLSTGGSAAVLKKRVEEYKLRPAGEPEIITGRDCTSEDIIDLLSSMVRMIGILMGDQVNIGSVGHLDFAIKKFLTHLDIVDRKFRKKEEKPRWISQYNLSSLHNMVLSTWMLGPVRNYWEGSYRGEAFLRFVKKEVNMGLRKGWQVSTLSRILRKRTCKNIEWKQKDMSRDIEHEVRQEEGMLKCRRNLCYFCTELMQIYPELMQIVTELTIIVLTTY